MIPVAARPSAPALRWWAGAGTFGHPGRTIWTTGRAAVAIGVGATTTARPSPRPVPAPVVVTPQGPR